MVAAIEVFYLLVMTQSIMVHVNILPLIYLAAGRDGWISALVFTLLGMLTVWAICRLRIAFSSGFDDFIGKIGGKFTLILLKCVFIVYFLFLSAYSLASLLDLIKYVFLPFTPLWAIALYFMLACVYLTYKGYKNIALVAGMLVYIAMFSGILISIFDMYEKNFRNLLPVMEFGLPPIIRGIFVLCSIWAEMLFLLFIPLDINKRKSYARACQLGVIANGLTAVLTISGVVMIFGLGQTKQLYFPSLEIVRLLTLGFVDRFDVYGEVLMIFGIFIRCGLFLRVALDQISPPSRRILHFITLLALGAAVMVAGILMARTHFIYMRYLHLYVYGIFMLTIPVFLYGLMFFRKLAGRNS
ncbi:MAG TPA: GerAB/ArcD/ProY family transporter [Bacilli bacterium]